MFTLKYFNGRGPAEVTRIMFAIAKVPFVDHRYPVNGDETPEFDADRDAGLLFINFDRLPILEYKGSDGEASIGQSKAIDKFVAKKLGFYGSNIIESALVDMTVEHIRDIKQKYAEAKRGHKGDALTAAKEKFISTDLPSWFRKLEMTLSGTDGFAVGNKLSLADISIHHIVKDYMDDLVGTWAATEGCPIIQSSAEKVQEAAQEWLDNRPKSDW